MDHIDHTLAIIITLIILLCVFQCAYYRNVVSRREQKSEMKEQEERFLSYNKLVQQTQRPYKTADSITRKENGINIVAGSHKTDLDKMGHRSAAKGMTMETFSSHDEGYVVECQNRGPLKHESGTASHNSVI
jgi:hypothetical protein